jgi:phage shock protein A
VDRLAALSTTFAETLAAAPRAADFEPLSESLYELARLAPRIAAGLNDGPASAAPLAESVEALRGLLESLETTQSAFADALLRMPRAEDYEPLAEPLREFARVTPALVESLREVPALARGVSDAVRSLEEATRRIEAAGAAASPPPGVEAVAAGPASDLEARLAAAAATVESARRAVAAALETLPRGDDYAPLAAQLRELATVSPSLMEWLSEVPRVEEPLSGSVASLRRAVGDLSSAIADLAACREALRVPEVSRRFPRG